MLKLVVATLAAMYLVAVTVGDDAGVMVARTEPDRSLEIGEVTLVSAANASVGESLDVPTSSRVSDAEAVQIALLAGAERRAEREVVTLLGATIDQGFDPVVAATPAAVAPADTAVPAGPIWQVTGSNVNLRAGPGTGNGIVTQLSLGTETTVLSENGGWYEIETSDGATRGWIYGKYLAKSG